MWIEFQKCFMARVLTVVVRGVRWGGSLMVAAGVCFVSCDRVKKLAEPLQERGEISRESEAQAVSEAAKDSKVAEARSKVAAVTKYPELGLLDSPFNKMFRERVGVLKRTQPSFFERSDWPERLADEIAMSGARGGSGAEAAGGSADSVLAADELRKHIDRHVGKHRTVKGVIQKIHNIDSSFEVVRFRLDGDLEVQMSRHEFAAIRGINAEFLKWRLRVEGGHLMVKGQEGFQKGTGVYFPKDTILLSEGAPVRVSGTVVVRGNRVWVEKARIWSVIGGI